MDGLDPVIVRGTWHARKVRQFHYAEIALIVFFVIKWASSSMAIKLSIGGSTTESQWSLILFLTLIDISTAFSVLGLLKISKNIALYGWMFYFLREIALFILIVLGFLAAVFFR